MRWVGPFELEVGIREEVRVRSRIEPQIVLTIKGESFNMSEATAGALARRLQKYAKVARS